MAGSAEALERFERQSAWPMLVLSLLILPLLIAPLIIDLSPGAQTTITTIDWIIWAGFAMEYGIRLYLAPAKRTFMRHNLIDLAVVLIPFLRPIRVARSARLLRLLNVARVAIFALRGLEAIRNVLTRHKLHYTLLITSIVTLVGGTTVAVIERQVPGTNIRTAGDGLWWAISTVTTVGYGDRIPVTPEGKGIGVVLMLLGVSVFGLFAASLASFFVERGSRQEEANLTDVLERLDRIERLLAPEDEPETPELSRSPRPR